MLPAQHRLRRRVEFTQAVRSGRRSGTPLLVGYLLVDQRDAHPPKVGFIVARAIGSAVVRNRVRRRLRHLIAERLAELPPGSLLVVRVLPPAGEADAGTLSIELDRVLSRLTRGER